MFPMGKRPGLVVTTHAPAARPIPLPGLSPRPLEESDQPPDPSKYLFLPSEHLFLPGGLVAHRIRPSMRFSKPLSAA
jgi:hypothetical protein